jgi:hypothetical protein
MLDIAIMTGYLAWFSKKVSHLISTHPSVVIRIINQIQATITSEAKVNYVSMKEIQQKDKRIQNIQDRP